FKPTFAICFRLKPVLSIIEALVIPPSVFLIASKTVYVIDTFPSAAGVGFFETNGRVLVVYLSIKRHL
ncbi:MAG: hypothetical protein PVJ29_15840, partial [Desulfobacterales bacterium]